MRTRNDTMKSLPLERRRKIETRATELETTLRLGEIPDEKNIVFSPAGENWASFKERLFTTEERRELDLRVEIISEMINAREDRGISQRELETTSGVAQPVISRVERGTTDPRISTLLKLLASLGKTLKVVPLEDEIGRAHV